MSSTNDSREDCQHPEPEMSDALKLLPFPLLLQEVVMEDGWGRGLVYNKAVFERQLGSSSEVSKVLKKVRIHLSPNPAPSSDLAWLACLLVASVVIHAFLWDYFKSLFPDDPTSFCNQLAVGEACQNLR